MDQQSDAAVSQEDDHDHPPEGPPTINLLKESLLWGFRPTDGYLAELLERKYESKDTSLFDFYSYDPEDWHLAPARENIHCHDDGKTYIFSPFKARVDGGVIIRETPHGRWMRTGKRSTVIEDSQGRRLACKGLLNFFAKIRTESEFNGNDNDDGSRKRRTMPTEVQTQWQMHEILLMPRDDDRLPGTALCVVYKTRPR
ncbi:hypothetical protein LINPERPRIM_LOCUS27735 [Linum perenne]